MIWNISVPPTNFGFMLVATMTFGQHASLQALCEKKQWESNKLKVTVLSLCISRIAFVRKKIIIKKKKPGATYVRIYRQSRLMTVNYPVL